MLYDYDEDEQSRNGAKNPKGYSPMPKQNDTASAPAARPRLIQRLRGSGPSELHPLIFLEARWWGFSCASARPMSTTWAVTPR